MPQEEDRLYILMRTDLKSMNPGKACAHSAHAATKFLFDFLSIPGTLGKLPTAEKSDTRFNYEDRIHVWAGSLGFGTKITLAANLTEVKWAVREALKFRFPAGIVRDPSYPIDPDFKVYRSTITCGFVFGQQEELQRIIGHLGLMK